MSKGTKLTIILGTAFFAAATGIGAAIHKASKNFHDKQDNSGDKKNHKPK